MVQKIFREHYAFPARAPRSEGAAKNRVPRAPAYIVTALPKGKNTILEFGTDRIAFV